jgi:hypothetical protein
MSRHKKHTHPVPPANRPPASPPTAEDPSQTPDRHEPTDGASFQEQDPQRRLGDFEGSGEHSRQQPGRANDGDIHSR